MSSLGWIGICLPHPKCIAGALRTVLFEPIIAICVRCEKKLCQHLCYMLLLSCCCEVCIMFLLNVTHVQCQFDLIDE